jgi:hypothetical protein
MFNYLCHKLILNPINANSDISDHTLRFLYIYCLSSKYLYQQLHDDKNKIVYRYITLLQYVSAYNGHLHVDVYQRKG